MGANMNMIARLLFCAALTLSCGPAFAAGKYIAYIGTYTGGPSNSKGIYALQADGNGHFKLLGLQAEVPSPSFLATDPSHRFLYAVTEREARGNPTGSLSSYAIDPATGASYELAYYQSLPSIWQDLHDHHGYVVYYRRQRRSRGMPEDRLRADLGLRRVKNLLDGAIYELDPARPHPPTIPPQFSTMPATAP